MGLFTLILQSFYFFLPAYVANMAPVLFRRTIPSLAIPIDNNTTWRGKPILGKNKTWNGVVVAILFGYLVFLVQSSLHAAGFQVLSLADYALLPWWTGALMGFGAIAGDAVKSFFKRRVDVASGKPWIPFDQIDFVIGGLLLTSMVYLPSWYVVLILIVGSPLLHILVNHLAFFLHIRGEKW